MERLFDSRGHHIANFSNGHLHAPNGPNIGHYLKDKGIFIDMNGRYLGEIYHGDRLLRKKSSPHKNVNYGNYGNYGNIGNYGNPGSIGSIGNVSGYEDVEL